jgi:hypothetical protein
MQSGRNTDRHRLNVREEGERAHLTFLLKPPPPVLYRWSDGFAPESVKTSDAPAGFIPVERWLKALMFRGDL